ALVWKVCAPISRSPPAALPDARTTSAPITSWAISVAACGYMSTVTFSSARKLICISSTTMLSSAPDERHASAFPWGTTLLLVFDSANPLDRPRFHFVSSRASVEPLILRGLRRWLLLRLRLSRRNRQTLRGSRLLWLWLR